MMQRRYCRCQRRKTIDQVLQLKANFNLCYVQNKHTHKRIDTSKQRLQFLYYHTKALYIIMNFFVVFFHHFKYKKSMELKKKNDGN